LQYTLYRGYAEFIATYYDLIDFYNLSSDPIRTIVLTEVLGDPDALSYVSCTKNVLLECMWSNYTTEIKNDLVDVNEPSCPINSNNVDVLNENLLPDQNKENEHIRDHEQNNENTYENRSAENENGQNNDEVQLST
jgi:hypothetical protein